MPPYEERLREEFYEKAKNWIKNQNGACCCMGNCANCDYHQCHGCLCTFLHFFEKKIADLRTEWVEEARREIAKLPNARIDEVQNETVVSTYNILSLPSFNNLLPTSSKPHRDTVEGGGDGNVRCCDNGDFGEKHECLKSNSK